MTDVSPVIDVTPLFKDILLTPPPDDEVVVVGLREISLYFGIV
jgi:hypothetical protein